MRLPHLLSIALIQKRLEAIFPAGIENRSYVTREMAAKIVFVMLYGGMVEGANRYFRPAHAYFYTDEQSTKNSERERHEWLLNTRKQGFRPPGVQWYADTTREPIRDETIRYGLLNIGAVGKLSDKPTTSSAAIYYLTADFAALFDPAHDGSQKAATKYDTKTSGWPKRWVCELMQQECCQTLCW